MFSPTNHEHQMLQDTISRFVESELMPHEDLVDRMGEVPEELGRQIE